MPVDLSDVCEARDEYVGWVLGGKENEDKGDQLRENLEETVRGFLMPDGSIDKSNLRFANANSDLQLKAKDGGIAIQLPRTAADPHDTEEHVIRPE